MRLRNIKNAQDIIEASPYLVNNIEEAFAKIQPLEIEIGCGKGNFIIEKAKRNPNINYIGIEKYASVLVSVVKKLKEENISNLRFMCLDAKEIENYFKHNVSKVYLNFSDPWPKKKHAKRRLTSLEFLKRYDKIFTKEPIIEMKTDNTDLFTYSIVSLSEYGYTLKEVIFNYCDEENIATEYEQKFRNLGYPIHKLTAIIHKK